MDAPRNWLEPLGLKAEEDAAHVVRVAASVGSEIVDDVFVSYTTLLVGLLLARLEPQPRWQEAAKRTLALDAILGSKSGLSVWRGVVLSEWPSGRPMFSVSAVDVLEEAARIARAERGEDAGVSAADIMASYLSVIPVAHRRQAEAWGFAEAAKALAPMLPGLASPAPEPQGASAAASSGAAPDLPDYDSAASSVLRLAFALRRRGEQRPVLGSEALLAALVAAAPLLPQADAHPARALRGMVGADRAAGPFRRRVEATFESLDEPATAAALVTGTWPPLTTNAQAILRDARALAQRASGSSRAGLRHLLAALIGQPDGTDRATEATAWLREAGVNTETLRAALARIIADRHGGDDQRAWQDFLIGRDAPVIAVARPDTIPPDPRAADNLGLRHYADAIAALIAARDQQPPLSIAVFGPWGSGKSFFMAMIRSAIGLFAAEAQAAHAARRATDARMAESPFLRRIVPIEFNAWHYAGGNLWASLVHAILVGIQDAMKEETEQSQFQAMLEQLNLREAARLEAEQRLREAEQRLQEARAALHRAEEAAAARRAEESRLKAEDVVGAVQAMALDALKPNDAAGAAAWIGSVGDSAAKAASYLGRPELAAQVPQLTAAAGDVARATEALQVKVGEVRELLEEAEASATRGLSLLGWLAHARLAPRDLLLAALVGGILLLVLIGLAQELERRGAEVAATASAVAAFVAPLIAALGSLLAWARRHLAEASRAFAVLGSLRAKVEAQQAQRLAVQETALATAGRLAAEAEAEATRRRAEAAAAGSAVAGAKAELAAASSAEQLKRFVAQRLAEGDYQRHLGLIHTIRSDLDRLKRILAEVHPGEAASGAAAPVERIVLFIDDLDRCPPRRVVEVLEAVHLLLAFPLFVVVVGVDVRWVAQALIERYPVQLGDAPGVASPVDYLEKVFQIPFRLPAMGAEPGRRLLEAAVGPARAAVPRAEGATGDAAAAARGAGGDDGGSDEAATSSMTGDRPAMPPPASAEAEQVRTPAPDARAAAEALVLEPRERLRLLDMAAAIGASPRRAKRFANLYRLLKASLLPAERRGFAPAGGEGGSHEAALILLAAATGAPRAAAALTRAMENPPGEDPGAWIAGSFAAAEGEASDAEQAAFAAARDLAVAAKDPALMARDLHFWAPRVTRFAFDAPLSHRGALTGAEPPA